MIRLQDLFLSATFILAACALFALPATAAPARCSGEQRICIADCNKALSGGALSTCVTNCGQRQAICVKTGCWDKFCGLLRQ
jgi:hypothetical protein